MPEGASVRPSSDNIKRQSQIHAILCDKLHFTKKALSFYNNSCKSNIFKNFLICTPCIPSIFISFNSFSICDKKLLHLLLFALLSLLQFLSYY